MNGFRADLRFALRTFRNSPGFACIAISTLALGMGAAIAMFSIVDAVLLKPLPYPQANRLAWIATTGWGNGLEFVVSPEYVEWSKATTAFEHMAAMPQGFDFASLTGAGEPSRIGATRVTASFFDTFRVYPMLGRPFNPSDNVPGAPHVAILGYGIWMRQFGADRNVIGRRIRIDGESYTVAGVMPQGFRFPQDAPIDVLTPIPMGIDPQDRKTMRTWMVVGRLKPGMTIEQARAEMETLFAATRTRYPQMYKNDIKVVVQPLQEHRVAHLRLALLVLLGAVGCVLLIACVNVANLLLSRGTARAPEFSVRAALGASRARLIRQQLTESLVLALAGTAAGFGVAAALLAVFLRIIPAMISGIDRISMNGRVAAFAIAAGFLTSLLCGILPALSTSGGARGSRTATSFATRWKDALVVLELGASVVLLIGVGLLFRGLMKMETSQLGFRPEHVLTARLWLHGAHDVSSLKDLRERLEAIPGVSAAALSEGPLPNGGSRYGTFNRPDRPQPGAWHRGDGMVVGGFSPDYFRALGIALKQGRYFTPQDQPDKVAIINETIAKRYYRGENPIGALIADGKRIVGVVADSKNMGLDQPPEAEMYLPYGDTLKPDDVYISARSELAPDRTAAMMRDIFRSFDKNMLATVQKLPDVLAHATQTPRFQTLLLGAFAGLALILAAIGVYGVIGTMVAQRTREFGIRVALGATPAHVIRLVGWKLLSLTGCGVAMGAIASLGLTRYLRGILYGVTPEDPPTYITVAVILLAVSILAAVLPIRKALAVDPAVALRAE